MERKQPEKILTTKDVAERWGVKPQYIRDLANSGELKTLNQFKHKRFALSYIEAYEDEQILSNETDQLTIRREVNKLRREITRLKEELSKRNEHIRKINNLMRQAQIEVCEYEIDVN